ncbi:MAG: dienelactone hydrolase family protein [Kiloniellales bacterium]|nr:dienelactone hydrolase family protein [Kiloniellales bacterium]
MGEIVSFDCKEGRRAKGYLAKAEAPKGAVIVLQEWWGLNDQIKGVADRFAAAGFTALSPDLYDGRVTQDADEAEHLMTGLDWVGATDVDVRGALKFLKKDHGKVAVMGFCMGGALTVIAGVKLEDCDAAVCYYGIPPKEAADPASMRVPFQGHFASKDEWCSPAAAVQLAEDLKASGVDHEMHSYEGCDHAFFNQERPEVYDADASQLSWERTLEFLNKHL